MFKICKDIKNENLEMRQVFAKVMDDLASKDDRVVYLDADIMNSIKWWIFLRNIQNVQSIVEFKKQI